jgi:cbb3-type cytochrome oxidase maturation protein
MLTSFRRAFVHDGTKLNHNVDYPMFANSVAVILLVLCTGLPTLLLLWWALRHGQFENLHDSSESIFDEEELRYIRPWENRRQAKERISAFGSPLSGKGGWTKWL